MIGIIVGVLGSLIGVAGGVAGTYFGIKHTKGPRERAFMVKVAAFFWVFVIALLVAMLAFPPSWKIGLWGVYGVVLPVSIVLFNRKQQQIREREAVDPSWKPPTSDLE